MISIPNEFVLFDNERDAKHFSNGVVANVGRQNLEGLPRET